MDNFDVKYVGENNAHHLTNAIRSEGYNLEVDWKGKQYCRITLDWDYEAHTLTNFIPGYVQK